MVEHRIHFKLLVRSLSFTPSAAILLKTIFYVYLVGKCQPGNAQMANMENMNSFEGSSPCSSVESPTNYALIPYNNNGILSQFYKTDKTFTIPRLKKQIMIKQDWSNNGVAGVVWEAAYVLSDFMSRNIAMHKKKVLELGAGTGLVGMTSMALGAEVTFTDIKKALPLLQENVDMNFAAEDFTNNTFLKPEIRELEWGINLDRFLKCSYDYILGADIIYREDTFDALLETLCHLSSCAQNDNTTKIILSSKLRYDRVEVFVAKLRKKFSSVRKVHEEESTNIVIYECF